MSLALLILLSFCALSLGFVLGRRVAPPRLALAAHQPPPGSAPRWPRAVALRRRRPGFTNFLTVRIQGSTPGRRLVESAIRRRVRRVEIDDIVRGPDGSETVRYLVQFDAAATRDQIAAHLLEEAQPHLLAAALS